MPTRTPLSYILQEEDELLADWAPEPLVAENVDATDAPELAVDGCVVVVCTHHAVGGRTTRRRSRRLLSLVSRTRAGGGPDMC